LARRPSSRSSFRYCKNFGISVLSEEAYEFNFTGDGQAQRVFIQSFQVRSLKGEPLDKLPGAPLLGEALVAVRAERAEDDQLNALTLAAGLSWREVALIRAYLAAAFQMKLAPARLAMRRPVLLYPRLARILVDLFTVRFNPDGETPAQKIAELKSAFLEQLAAVDNIADDRMARTLLAMVEATVRTNYFCEIPSPDPYIALKFESAKFPTCPIRPRPTRFTSTARGWRDAICEPAASPAAASATATVPTITAPKSSTS